MSEVENMFEVVQEYVLRLADIAHDQQTWERYAYQTDTKDTVVDRAQNRIDDYLRAAILDLAADNARAERLDNVVAALIKRIAELEDEKERANARADAAENALDEVLKCATNERIDAKGEHWVYFNNGTGEWGLQLDKEYNSPLFMGLIAAWKVRRLGDTQASSVTSIEKLLKDLVEAGKKIDSVLTYPNVRAALQVDNVDVYHLLSEWDTALKLATIATAAPDASEGEG